MAQRRVRISRAVGRRWRPLPLLGRALILSLLMTLFVSLGSALGVIAQTTLYLRGGVGDHPLAPLSSGGPQFSALQNYDPSRDSDPGLTVKKGGNGAGESDDSKYQMWIAPVGGYDLAGPASLTFWGVMKDGLLPDTSDKGGEVSAFLLDCSPSRTDCSTIASDQITQTPWNPDGEWEERTADFGVVSHAVDPGRVLAVKIIVGNNSDDDMWFAYNTTTYDSHLSITVDVPATTTTTTSTTTTLPPTTTTSTTTTTTLPGPSTTTTTSPPSGTTTTTSTSTTLPGATTTTSLPGQTTTTTSSLPGQTTTTTTVPETTTTTSTTVPEQTTTSTAAPGPGTTSTTVATVAGPPDPGAGEPPDQPPGGEDRSVTGVTDSAADVDVPTVVAAVGAPVAGSFIEGLEIVLPPAVAEVLASPLLILELLFRAFADSGRSLLIPSLLLSLIAGWLFTYGPKAWPFVMGWRRRREEA